MLDKLAFLLYSTDNKCDKFKRQIPKVRRFIVSKALVRGKNQVTERGTNFIVFQVRSEEWLLWWQVCHTYLKPFCTSYLTQIRLREIF